MIHLPSLLLARPFRGIVETVSSTPLVSREFAGQSSRKNLEPFDLIRLMAHRAQRSISPNTPERVVRTEDLDPVEARFAHRRSGRLLDFIIIGIPVGIDATVAPSQIEVLARVAAQTGEPDRAIAILEKVWSRPA
jgi:hypothetical protein